MHNLGTVYKFEVIRTLKKKSFWIMALAFPVAMAAIFGIVYLSNKTTEDAANKMKEATFSMQVTDDSHMLSKDLLASIKATAPSNKQAGIDAVKQGQVDAYIYYPADLSKDKVEVYAKDVGMFDNGKYDSVARALISQSASMSVNSNVAAVLSGKATTNVSTYRDGVEYDGFKQMLAPGLFLVLFYFLIAMFGNQMLTSTTEEKENRVIEMILTTVRAKTLIVGKVLSLISLAFIQAIVFLLPVLVGYLLLHDKLSLPALNLSDIPFDIPRIIGGLFLFIFSFLLFTGLLVAVGAASPTAKEAGGYLGVVMLLLFGPLYAASLFISSPDSPFVQFLTYFPLTAPIPAMLRNAVGNLPFTDTLVVIALLAISASIVMSLAVRVFRSGAIEYSRNMLPAFLQRKK